MKKSLDVRMTTALATLAVAEEDVDDGDDEDKDKDNDTAGDAEICAFDVPYFRFIDDDGVEEKKEEKREGGWRDERSCTWFSGSADEGCCDSSSYRYVVVSGTPLKILEHLLSDLRLDDHRGVPESRESGEFGDQTSKLEHSSVTHVRRCWQCVC